MKIFVITAGYPSKENPSSCIFIQNPVNYLYESGNDVIVLNPSNVNYKYWFQKDCFIPRQETNDGVLQYILHTRGLLAFKLPQRSIRLFEKNLNKIFKLALNQHGKPDVIFAHVAFEAGYISSKLAKKHNIPLVVMEHCSIYLQEKIHETILKILVETVDQSSAFICVSNHLKQAIEDKTQSKNKIEVIYNMLDKRFEFYQINNQKQKFTFFAAGNLSTNKRFDLLITSFCKAFSKDELVELKIAGAGSSVNEESKLKILINDNDRVEQIELLGRLNTDKMLEQYIGCNVFVLPSCYETFGIVYREAMAVGRPIISAKNGGIEENWEDSFGVLIDIDNEEQLVDSMQYMRANFDKYDLETISKKTLELYSQNVIGAQIEDILKSVISGETYD